ncbi:thiazole biosynthesis ThiH domain protein [Clostridioides difficile DA00165]|nr:thiazole biosynthesis ThiH domain protein [Clostridioides difficile DA00165]
MYEYFHAAINISTRENLEMRSHIIPLGVTKLSAGVSTDEYSI